jgi:pilus assembly protein CpaB
MNVARPNINKNVLFLGGAAALGLLAAMMSVGYVQQRAERAEAEAAASRTSFQETQVVVSRRDLAIGDVIRESDLVTRQVPVDFVPADALTMGNFEQYLDRIVRAPIRRGTPLSASALVAASEQFSRVIAPGRVGYTLSVNENNSISGMVAPGDRVDILLAFNGDRNPGTGNGGFVQTGDRVVPLLENITVLATGSRVGEVPGQQERGFSSVTLELDPAQAETLTVAQQTGNLRVLLRNLDDQTPFGLGGLSERAMLTGFGGVGGDAVEFIIGGRR